MPSFYLFSLSYDFRCLVFFGLLLVSSYGYDDIEKKCDPGQKTASWKRSVDGGKPGRIATECASFKPSADAVKVSRFSFHTGLL